MKITVHTLIFLSLLVSQQLIAQTSPIFYDDFEEGGFRSEWILHPGQENGLIEVFPSEMLQGEYLVRLGKSRDGKFALNRLDLPLDLSSYDDVELRMSLTHNDDNPHVQDGIYLSDDGEHFIKVFSFAFDEWPAKAKGALPPLNLKDLALQRGLKLNKNFVIRFQQYGDHDFVGGKDFSDGLYIDEITVQVPPATYATLPFSDDFENQWLPAWSVGNPGTEEEVYINPSSVVEIVAIEDSTQHAVRLGNTLDSHLTTNALDLHLDLSGQDSVALSFKIYNNHDETHPQDGILFSDDGGEHFVKVYDFNLSDWESEVFGQLPPLSVDQLAQAHGLKLTDRFVIRFQQHDDDDFEGSRLSSDGYYLDDVAVYPVRITYASLPIFENFEDSLLASYWYRSTPDTALLKPTGVAEIITPDSTKGRVLRLGSLVDRSSTTNTMDLHVNLTKAVDPELSFWIYDNFDETHPQDGVFFSSNGGKSFVKVYDFDGDLWGGRAIGQVNALNIRELAKAHQLSLTDRFVIRFQQYDDDDFEGTRTTSDGIYLDNIRVQEPSISYYRTLPFTESFESDTLAPYWRHGNLSKTVDDAFLQPTGLAMLTDTMGHKSNQALMLGKLVDGPPAASGLDLCLNLANQKDLFLSFWLYSNYDMEDEQDGIWLSNNGGRTFEKAYTFDHSHHQQYAQYTLNMDSLLREAKVQYTDRFIVRFQQLGDRRANGEGSFRSGIFLDNIVITDEMTPPAASITEETNSPQ